MRSPSPLLILIFLCEGLIKHCRCFTPLRNNLRIHSRFALSVGFNQDEDDTLEKYEQDVTKVLKDIRGSAIDPTLPADFRTLKSSFSNIWTLETWKRHTSRWRYLRCIASIPASRLMRRILPQLLVLLLWTCCGIRYTAKIIEIPMTSLSLVSTFVAFLLTLRSNQGLSRLGDGRMAWGRVVLHTRDISQLVATYVYPKDKKLALLMARHISLFGWMLLSHIRESNEDDIVHTMLPNPVDAAYVLRQRKRPVGLIVRLRQCVAQLSDDNQFKNPQHSQLEKNISDLNNLIMICEALRATPIPPIYTHHTSRLLVLYLTVLPLALHGAIANGWVTILATGTVGFAMLGLDEISHLLEQPFRLMPLYQLSKTSMLDVADAFCCLPPALMNDATSSDVLKDDVTLKPVYW